MTTVLSRIDLAPPPEAAAERNLRPNYRADIDGLRAIAILSVVAFHLNPDFISGGYLGVDVFFVISGFLISTIIFRSLENGRFSFMEFYAHRIRRIFPGLILVIAFCILVGWNALLPNEFVLLGKHVFASASFTENFRLQREAGYFDVATSLKPLMHLWSLAIEEQFYLVFPLILWCAWRLRWNALVVVALIFAASFGAYVHDALYKPIIAFFSPRARFWELMAGAMLAYAMLHRAETMQALRSSRIGRLAVELPSGRGTSVMSLLGLSLVGLALFGTNRVLPLPKLTGEIFAVSGAAFLIFSGPAGWVNRFVLSHRVAVFIGLISYPLYLWHWPLLSFLTIVNGNYPPFDQRLFAVLISFVLAALTFRFVELPIRQSRAYRAKAAMALLAASIGMLVLGVLSQYVTPSYDPATSKIIEAWDFGGYPQMDGLHVDNVYDFGALGRFTALGENERNRVMFIGDSHAIQYRWSVHDLFKNSNLPQAQLPIVTFVNNFTTENLDIMKPIFDKILRDERVKTIIFSEFWALQRQSSKINYSVRCCGEGLMQMMGTPAPPPMSEERVSAVNKGLQDLINLMRRAGKEFYVILDNPFGEELAPRFLLNRSFFHKIRISVTPLSKAQAIARSEPFRSEIQNIARLTGAKIIDPIEHLCDDTCPALSADGTPIYKDYDHLSQYTLTHRVHYLDFILKANSGE